MFGFRYARSAIVEAVFFFEGDSECKNDVGAGNESVSSENALLVDEARPEPVYPCC